MEQEAIRDFHEKIFLPDLLDAAESKVDGDPDVAHEVARVFIAHAAFLKYVSHSPPLPLALKLIDLPPSARIYSSYVNSFDSALNRLQTWTVEPRPRTSNGGTVTVLPQDQAGVSPITSSQRKRIKSYLKVRSSCRLPYELFLISTPSLDSAMSSPPSTLPNLPRILPTSSCSTRTSIPDASRISPLVHAARVARWRSRAAARHQGGARPRRWSRDGYERAKAGKRGASEVTLLAATDWEQV